MVLNKQKSMFARDEAGKLIPKEVDLVLNAEDGSQDHLKGETIWITPMVRGELGKIFVEMKDKPEHEINNRIIVDHCFDPKWTDANVIDIKGPEAVAIVETILFESGLTPKKPKKQAIEERETDFEKNSLGSENKEKKAN